MPEDVDELPEISENSENSEISEISEAAATYYNLQGVEVKNPSAGIYVKVANGKASKVTIR